MTADEIRNKWSPGHIQAEHMSCATAEILQEITAQIAEMNGLKSMEMGIEICPPMSPLDMVISRSNFDEIMKIVEVARNISKLPPAMEPDCDQEFDHLRMLIEAYDDIPF